MDNANVQKRSFSKNDARHLLPTGDLHGQAPQYWSQPGYAQLQDYVPTELRAQQQFYDRLPTEIANGKTMKGSRASGGGGGGGVYAYSPGHGRVPSHEQQYYTYENNPGGYADEYRDYNAGGLKEHSKQRTSKRDGATSKRTTCKDDTGKTKRTSNKTTHTSKTGCSMVSSSPSHSTSICRCPYFGSYVESHRHLCYEESSILKSGKEIGRKALWVVPKQVNFRVRGRHENTDRLPTYVSESRVVTFLIWVFSARDKTDTMTVLQVAGIAVTPNQQSCKLCREQATSDSRCRSKCIHGAVFEPFSVCGNWREDPKFISSYLEGLSFVPNIPLHRTGPIFFGSTLSALGNESFAEKLTVAALKYAVERGRLKERCTKSTSKFQMRNGELRWSQYGMFDGRQVPRDTSFSIQQFVSDIQPKELKPELMDTYVSVRSMSQLYLLLEGGIFVKNEGGKPAYRQEHRLIECYDALLAALIVLQAGDRCRGTTCCGWMNWAHLTSNNPYLEQSQTKECFIIDTPWVVQLPVDRHPLCSVLGIFSREGDQRALPKPQVKGRPY